MIMSEFMSSIDWEQLQEQKMWINTMANYVNNPEYADGLLHLLDALQDLAVTQFEYTEEEVFGESNGID